MCGSLTFVEELDPQSLRVLACLLEKEATTPDQYPLTLNSLRLACNQTSNRSPVVSYDDATIEATLDSLRERGLARVVHSVHHRAVKYRHVVGEVWGLTNAELAVLAVLSLRGPQTLNDLVLRTERYPARDELGGVEKTLDRLSHRYDEPYVTNIGRLPGQREDRWVQLLGGPPDAATLELAATEAAASGSAPRSATAERLNALEAEVRLLRTEVEDLRVKLADLLD